MVGDGANEAYREVWGSLSYRCRRTLGEIGFQEVCEAVCDNGTDGRMRQVFFQEGAEGGEEPVGRGATVHTLYDFCFGEPVGEVEVFDDFRGEKTGMLEYAVY